MNNFKKADLVNILNVYQNHINKFLNLGISDIDKMYKEITNNKLKTNNKKEYQLNFNSQEINLLLKAMHKTYAITDKRKILIDIETKLYNAKQKLNNKDFISLH